ncbi:MAG: hypothetical protein R3332_07780 [Pseudohongiellaceae bacterium]|nr:hypothetical protein [Pseudohongiellaceae bacterium]
MYISRSTLLLLLSSYLLFLLSADWVSQPDGAWYRPFIISGLIILVAAFCHREQHSDEL